MKPHLAVLLAAVIGALGAVFGFILGGTASAGQIDVCRPTCYALKGDRAGRAEIIGFCGDNKYMVAGAAENLSAGIGYLRERNFPLCEEPKVVEKVVERPIMCQKPCYEWHNANMVWQWHGAGPVQQFPTVICDRCPE